MKSIGCALLLSSVIAFGQVSFGPSQDISNTINRAIHTAAHDMDPDGDLDVIAAEDYAVRVVWWENDGNGNFAPGREWLWGGLNHNVIAIEDANDDGNIDIHIYSEGDVPDQDADRLQVWIAYGDASGGFGEPALVLEDTGPGSSFRDAFLLDLDGNGYSELITDDWIYFDNGAAAYQVRRPIADHDDDVLAADVDGDDVDDFVQFDGYGDRIEVFRNNGDGTFGSRSTLIQCPSGAGLFGAASVPSETPMTADTILAGYSIEIDGATNYIVSAYQKNGSGNYEQVASETLPLLEGDHKLSDYILRQDPRTGAFFLSAFAAPVSSSWQGIRHWLTRISELRWDGSSLLEVPLVYTPSAHYHTTPTFAPLDNNATEDLLLTLSELPGNHGPFFSQLTWHGNTGPDSYSPTGRPVSNPAVSRFLDHVGDIDNDGDPDLLVGESPSLPYPAVPPGLVLWKNDGSGDHFERTEIPLAVDRVRVIDVLDIVGTEPSNPDPEPSAWPAGRLDFLVRTYEFESPQSYSGDSGIAWMLQDSDGMFHTVPASAKTYSTGNETYRYLDWDDDGTKDIIVAVRSGLHPEGMALSWMKGSGFEFLPAQPLPSNDDGAFEFIDMDWDGDLDLLTSGHLFGSHSSYWYENQGDGTIPAVRLLPGIWARLEADLDGDGHEDFGTHANQPNSSRYSLARPGVTIESTPFSPPFSAQKYLDLDNDGDPDELHAVPIFWTTPNYRFGWRENRGPGVFLPGGKSDPEDFPMHLIAPVRMADKNQLELANLDGDGTKDLIAFSGGFAPRIEWFKITHAEAPAAFTSFMETMGATGHSAGLSENWDSDSFTNWQEFWFGSNPTAPDPNHPGRPAMGRDASGVHFTFQRRTDADLLGLTYHTRWSTNLETWNLWTQTPVISVGDPGYERATFLITPGEDAMFFGTDVNWNPSP